MNRRRFLTLSAGVATAATLGGAATLLPNAFSTAHAATMTSQAFRVISGFPSRVWLVLAGYTDCCVYCCVVC